MTDIDMNCSIELNDITDIIFAVIDDYYDGDIDEKTAFTDLLDDLEPYAFRVDYDDLTCIALKRELLISIEDDLPFGIDLDIHPDYSIGAILHSLVSFVSQTESEHSTI